MMEIIHMLLAVIVTGIGSINYMWMIEKEAGPYGQNRLNTFRAIEVDLFLIDKGYVAVSPERSEALKKKPGCKTFWRMRINNDICI